MTGVLILILVVAFFALFVFLFRSPAPRIDKLIIFLFLLAVGAVLAYLFAVHVLDYDPDPERLTIARAVTADKIIDLTQIVPGLPADLDYIYRLDTDLDGNDPEDQKEEWFVFYRYDSATQDHRRGIASGPFGAAIYDTDWCRPPAILSYELVPVDYDYLGQTWALVAVENAIVYQDPVSMNEDRPEVFVSGLTYGAVTDLNVFRKVGVPLDCIQRQAWQDAHPGEPFPNPLRYANIGSFRGNFEVRRGGNVVVVAERSPFERSQIVIERRYRPLNGSYFQPGTETLVPPFEYGLAFGTGTPENVPEVYYPEKAVLAFYRKLTTNRDNLKEADSYLSKTAQEIYDIRTDPFGLSTDLASVARARENLARVLVWEIRYRPDIEAERLHRNREVTVVVAGVNADGQIDVAHPCEVTWTVVGVPNPNAQPYGCEWRLETYWSTCAGGK